MLLVDHADSFTYNIADLIHRVVGAPPTVWDHRHGGQHGTGHVGTGDHHGDLTSFDAIVVGPGPGRPQHAGDLGLSEQALRQDEVPVLGVCLGMQGMAHLAGDAVAELAVPVHGQVSEVLHDGTDLFAGVPSPFEVVRYHSLEVRPDPSSPLQVTAWAADDGAVMALSDPTARRWGVQFHPESVLSAHGAQILANFFRMASVRTAAPPPDALAPVAVGDVHRPTAPDTADARPVRVRSVRVGGRTDTWALHRTLLADSPTAFWLDASSAARCSVLGDGSGPLSYVLTHRVGSGTTLSTGEHLPGPLLPHLATLRDRFVLRGDPHLPHRFRPGFVGYLGYELKAETGGQAVHRSPHPDARLVFADRAVVVDHEDGSVHAVYLEDDRVRAVQERWVETVRQAVVAAPLAGADQATGLLDPTDPADPRDPADPAAAPVFRHTRPAYLDLVDRCQAQIRAGESYEICLTNAARWPGQVEEVALARAMRSASPVPFAAWLRGPGPTVLSASPERFVSVTADGRVEARPIKGTRPRGSGPDSDAALAEELRASVKDRAENLMIVDLLRNDLHRVCRAGSVHVPGIFEVESYATVHQLVSTVRGRLAEGMGALDVIGTCFPGGSMTGAPKVRTMQILDRLEGGPRGVYSGALGWIGLDGAMDLSIVIRTVTLEDGVARFGVGGAVTALSDPAEEYAETLVKARALTTALAAATVPGDVARNRSHSGSV